jgi:hypothetical protein
MRKDGQSNGWKKSGPEALVLFLKKSSAGFRCFQGPLNRESDNCSFYSTKYGSSDHTRRHDLSVTGSWCGS